MARYSIDGQILTDMADNIRTAHYEPVEIGRRDFNQPSIYGSLTFTGKYTKYFHYKLTIIDNTPADEIPEDRMCSIGSNDTSQHTWHTFAMPTPGTYEEYFIAGESGTGISVRFSSGGVSKATIVVTEARDDKFADNHTPEEMVARVGEMAPLAAQSRVLTKIIDRSATAITAADLAGISVIGNNCFYKCENLTSLELPEGITRIGTMFASECALLKEVTLPSTVESMASTAFYMASIQTVTLLNENQCVDVDSNVSSSSIGSLKTIRVPGKLYSQYKSSPKWAAAANLFVPYDAWVSEYNSKVPTVMFGESVMVTIPLMGFDYVPEWNMTCEGPASITGDCTATELTLNVTDIGEEGNYTINITIIRNDGVEIPVTLTGRVLAEFVQGTYTVSNPSTNTYTFVLNDAGYYESNCQKQSSKYAFCRVHIHNPSGQNVRFDCINFAEANYDYGLFGKVDNDCSTYSASTMESNAYFSFKGKSLATVQTVTYTDAIGECFIDIMYKKDGSGDNNNDSLQFQVIFE